MVETFQIDITIRFKTPVTKPHFRKFVFKFSEQFPHEFNLFFSFYLSEYILLQTDEVFMLKAVKPYPLYYVTYLFDSV